MASVAKDPNGRKRILFVVPDGKRKTMRLGKVPQRMAEAIKVKVEHLVAAKVSGCGWDNETARWVAELPDKMADKLAAAGLIPTRERAVLGDFLESYIEKRIDVKGDIKVVWGHTKRNLVAFFGDNKLLREITPGDAEDFRLYLVGRRLSATTIHKRMQVTRMFFRPVSPVESSGQAWPSRPQSVQRREGPGWGCLPSVLFRHARGDRQGLGGLPGLHMAVDRGLVPLWWPAVPE